MLFESYCKQSITNAVKKERKKKYVRWQLEQPLSSLTDDVLYTLSTKGEESERHIEPCHTFHIQNMSFPIYDQELSRALSHLMPSDREIVLLYYCAGLKDVAVAPLVHMSRATVSRRRIAAVKRLRELMEGPI